MERPPIDPIRGDFGFDSTLLNFERISLKLISFDDELISLDTEFRELLDLVLFWLLFLDFLEFVDDLTDSTEDEDCVVLVDDFRDKVRGVAQLECVYFDIELWVISLPLSWIETDEEFCPTSESSFDALADVVYL